MQAMRQANDFERDFDVLAALAFGEVREQQRQLDVALGGEHRHEVVELEHEADVVRAPAGELAAAELIDAAAADADLARGRLIESADEIEERRLARARRTHERDEVALGDVEIEPVQDFDLLPAALVDLGDLGHLDHGFGHGNLSSIPEE